MPNRYLRESYIESERVNSLGWIAEAFWTRLLVKVDDFGRAEANPKLLRAKIFPLKLDQVREADVSRLLLECEKAGLIRLYSVAGKQYLQMERWENGRASASKFPDPPEHTPTDSGVCLQPPEDSPDTDTDTDTDTDINRRPAVVGKAGVEFALFWQAYPKRKNKGDAEKAWKKVKVPIETILAALEHQRKSHDWTKEGGKYIPYPASWLNGRRWEDEESSGAESELAGFTMVDPLGNP